MRTEEINNHQVFQLIQQIKTRLSQKDADQIKTEEKQFIIDCITYVELRIKNSFHSLLDISLLNQLQNYFQNALYEINNFFANKNYGHINNALSNLKPTITLVNQIPIIITDEIKELNEIVNNFRILIDSEETIANKTFQEIKNNLTTVTNQLQTTQTELKNVENRVNQIINNFQNEYNQLKQQLKNQNDEEKNNLIKESQNLINQLNTKLDEAKKIVNIIGNIGVTGDYQKYAEYHRKQANLWRCISIGFMSVSIFFLGMTLLNIENYDWHISLLRILSTILFVYPAQYAASQSSKHREQEIFNKKMELDLSAINPFIELFDEKKKQEIKEKLVEKYFNNNIYSNKNDTDISVTTLDKIINQIINIINNVKK